LERTDVCEINQCAWERRNIHPLNESLTTPVGVRR